MAEIKFYENPAACGTEHYYYSLSYFAPLIATDGVMEMFGTLACFWIGDIVASYLPKLQKPDSFFSVKVFVNEGKAHIQFTDGNENPIVAQKIEYTDLKENIHMFLQIREVAGGSVWVLMLPSEY